MKKQFLRMLILCLAASATWAERIEAGVTHKATHKISYILRNIKIVEGQVFEIPHGESFRFKVEKPANHNFMMTGYNMDGGNSCNLVDLKDDWYEVLNVTGDIHLDFRTRRDADNGYSADDDGREVYFKVNKKSVPGDSLIVKDSVYLKDMGYYSLRGVSFNEVDHLKSITFQGYKPPSLSFTENLSPIVDNLKIYVPKGARKAYLAYLAAKLGPDLREANVIESEEGTFPTEPLKVTYNVVDAQLVDAPTSIPYGSDLTFKLQKEDGGTITSFSGAVHQGDMYLRLQQDQPGLFRVKDVYNDLEINVEIDEQTSLDDNLFSLRKSDLTASLLRNYANDATEVLIPGTVMYEGQEYAVTRINHRFPDKLTAITIPGDVYDIGYSLENCVNLRTLKFSSDYVPGIQINSLNKIDTLTCKLLVPKGCLDTYKRNAVWGKFKNIEEYDNTSVSVSNWFDNNYLEAGKECQPLPLYMDFSSLEQDYRIVFEMEKPDQVSIRYGSDNSLKDGKPLKFTEGKAEIRKSECRVDTEGGKMRVIPYLAVTPKTKGDIPFTVKVYDESGTSCLGTFPSVFKAVDPVSLSIDTEKLSGNIKKGIPFVISMEKNSLGDFSGKEVSLDLYAYYHADENLALSYGESKQVFTKKDFATMSLTLPLTLDKEKFEFVLTGDSATSSEEAYLSFALRDENRIIPINGNTNIPMSFYAVDTVTVSTTDTVIAGQEVENITIAPAPDANPADTISVTLDNVATTTLSIPAVAKAELTLTNEVALGEVKNEGTLIISGTPDTKLEYTSVENKGVLEDQTGQILEVTGTAALSITPLNDQTVEEGSTVTLTAVAVTEAEEAENIEFQWQKWNAAEEEWQDVVEKAETKALLRAVTQKNSLTVASADAGDYRCRITRLVNEVSTTLTVYSTVTVASSEPDYPEISTYEVVLPAIEGASTTPEAGSYTIEEGASFVFEIVLEEGYRQSEPVVKAGDQVIEADANGKYTISNVYSDMTISITGIVKDVITSNTEVDENTTKVWGADGKLHIRSPKEQTAYIITFGGQVYKVLSVNIGETALTMPQGAYIIYIGKRSYKLRF